MNTSSQPSGASGLRNSERAGGARNSRATPAREAALALMFSCFQPPPPIDISNPKTARLAAQIHREPPRVPVNSYHWIQDVVLANELPRTSHGQLIWAEVRYHRSQAIQAKARKRYGSAPLRLFLPHLNRLNTRDIWKALATEANIPPPTVALQTQKVVAMFQRRKQRKCHQKNPFNLISSATRSANSSGTKATRERKPVPGTRKGTLSKAAERVTRASMGILLDISPAKLTHQRLNSKPTLTTKRLG